MNDLSIRQIQQLAEEAYIYAYPMMEDYKTMYGQNIAAGAPTFKKPFNVPYYFERMADSSDTDIVRYNNDNLYIFTRLDLRREPMIVTVPDMGEQYYVIQIIDMFTHNPGFIGTRATGGRPGKYMIAGPNWSGEKPGGIKRVYKMETNFVYTVQRTAVSPDEIDKVASLNKSFVWQPLHEVLGTEAPPAAQQIDFPPYDKELAGSAGFITYFNFLLGQVVLDDYEQEVIDRFEPIGIGPDRTFDINTLDEETLQAIEEGVKAGQAEIIKNIYNLGEVRNGWQVFSNIFGNHERMRGRYVVRAAAAMAGLYGNDVEEAYYPSTYTDINGDELDASQHKYKMHFEAGNMPPVNAFWSVTLYQMPSQTMTENPINRYSIGDRTTGLQYNEDGSLTIYIQHESPGADKESNWLPANNGKFTLQFRAYMPKPEAIKSLWAPPAVELES